jgi:hypothetical protein
LDCFCDPGLGIKKSFSFLLGRPNRGRAKDWVKEVMGGRQDGEGNIGRIWIPGTQRVDKERSGEEILRHSEEVVGHC